MAKKGNSSKTIESRIFMAMGIVGILGAIFTLSPNITGNVIGELSTGSSNLLGMIFLTIGLAAIWISRIRD